MRPSLVRRDHVELVTTRFGSTRHLVENGAGEGPNIMIRHWSAGTHVPRHAHQAHEMFFVLSGQLEIDGERYGEGSCLFIPATIPYGPIDVIEDAALLRYIEVEPAGTPSAFATPPPGAVRAATPPPATLSGAVAEGQMVVVPGAGVDGTPVLLTRVEGVVFAVDSTCSHAAADLGDGELDRYEVACPLHWAQFDVRDGSVTCGPARVPLRSYAVDERDGTITIGEVR